MREVGDWIGLMFWLFAFIAYLLFTCLLELVSMACFALIDV